MCSSCFGSAVDEFKVLATVFFSLWSFHGNLVRRLYAQRAIDRRNGAVRGRSVFAGAAASSKR